jgi:hypothetical protein
MNLQDIIASLVLLSFLANVADHLFTRRGDFFCLPRSGRLRRFFAAWAILLGVLAALCFFHTIPVIFLVVAGAAWMICSQAYAIVSRHSQARMTP